MPIQMKGNYIFTRPGERAYLISSNYVNYFELGHANQDDYYFEAKIEKENYVITAKLYNKKGEPLCEIKDNIIKGGNCKIEYPQHDFTSGFKLVDKDGNINLELALREKICMILGSIYNNRGDLIAKGDGTDLLVYKGPAVLGKMNGSRGIVIE
jgi:hypothetical protein